MAEERARTILVRLYGQETGEAAFRDLAGILRDYRSRIPAPRRSGLDERDAILITYADQVQEPGRPGLRSLNDFCKQHFAGLISGVHILPFFPWSSDDGFSVKDYEAVDVNYGTWDDIQALGRNFRLMFDAVINHASAQGKWFQAFQQDDPEYLHFFIEVQGNPNLSQVVRPRALPLLSELGRPDGARLWTTFSPDQVDLNYGNPRVLLRVIEVILCYASHGAQFIRLDAIAYLWKQVGTACINLPQTHWIVQLLRAVLDEVAPHVLLITETNVPNLENLSYFGDGSNEAQLVYNFPLPPLVLHAMHTGQAETLTRWAATLRLPSDRVTFLNFLASHDGIGLNPVRGILPEAEIDAMAERIKAGGGYISSKTNANGTQSPYELNANYFDALACADSGLSMDLQVQRFVTAHAILLAFQGVPAIYFHSLVGSRGWPKGVSETQKYRAINREKLDRARLEKELADAHNVRAHILAGLSRLLRARGRHRCFAPQAMQRVAEVGAGVFGLIRRDPESGEEIVCLHNVTAREQRVPLHGAAGWVEEGQPVRELISDAVMEPAGTITLPPYASAWLIGGAHAGASSA